jgi:hypothetical protein
MALKSFITLGPARDLFRIFFQLSVSKIFRNFCIIFYRRLKGGGRRGRGGGAREGGNVGHDVRIEFLKIVCFSETKEFGAAVLIKVILTSSWKN